MLKVEKNNSSIQGYSLSIVFDEWTDLELVNEYKTAIQDAIRCISQDGETNNTFQSATYGLSTLLEQMEFGEDEQNDIVLCKTMNQKRLEILRELPHKIRQNKEMTKEEQELKKLLFD